MITYSPESLLKLNKLTGRWFINQVHGQSVLYTTNLGSRLRFDITGACKIMVNVLDNRHPLSPSQFYAWRLNNGPWHREAAQNSHWSISCSADTHQLEIMTAGNTDFDQVWSGKQGFALSSIVLDEGVLSPAPALPIINFIGDSITAGCWVNGRHASYDYRPETNYIGLAVEQVGVSEVRIAYSAGGVLRQATGGVPVAKDFLLQLDQDHPWIPNSPILTVVNLGVNDRSFAPDLFAKNYNEFISLVEHTFPKSKLALMIPFSQTFAEIIREVATTHQLPLIETAGWCTSYTDNLHPNQVGAKESAHYLAPLLAKLIK